MSEIKTKPKNEQFVLDIGCGSSKLLEHLYRLGYNHLKGIDFNQEIIDFNKKKYQALPNFEFFCMNAIETDFFD